MSTKIMYVIRDDVSLDVSPIFLVAGQAAAEREFDKFLDGVPFAPENYSLFSIGAFDLDDLTVHTESDWLGDDVLSRVRGRPKEIKNG